MMTHYVLGIPFLAVTQIERGLHALTDELWVLLCGPIGPNLRKSYPVGGWL